ncbi:MAG TPA: M14 metallopeptidase family protein [Longimicrobiales bacterium]|nr:M14 metallopeptidase family protein [Longimicrobiales bacterium]
MIKRLALGFVLISATALTAQVTSPQQQFGHIIGADYVLPNYKALTEYWRKLDAESDRMIVQSIGKSAEGRDQLMAIVTSPANHARLARYKDIARRLATVDGLSDTEARAMALEGKAVVWIDGGLHATEVLGAQQLMETVYQLVSRNDPETLRILDDVIILAVHANPDGMDLVSDWYMRTPEPTKRSTSGLPRLYQKYAGHDNNRDSYMNALAETRNMSRVQFREWFPHIVYNHHQSGPEGSVLFAPPFRDPFNFNFDPLIPAQIEAVGAAMHSRFIEENKPGAVTRGASGYSAWWNGGIRTTVYFHNMIGLLTESIGNPTPTSIPFNIRFQLPSASVYAPIEPQKEWHFRQSIDYSVTANYAVLDYASRHREQLLYNIYRMGRNSIERGSRDNWTRASWQMDELRLAAGKDSAALRNDTTFRFFQLLRDQAKRDARVYVLPSTQRDFPTATKFVNTLIMSGVSVQRARASFAAGGKTYPPGSYVIKAAQPFRPHVLDMFEPQQHPNDFQYPGGPPIPPYDNAGYTLAYQMGVQFDRILEDVTGPFETLSDVAPPPAGVITGSGGAGYSLSRAQNDAFRVANRLSARGFEVVTLPSGALAVKNKSGVKPAVEQLARETGVSFTALRNFNGAKKLSRPRVALWDEYGGSSESGWIRYILESFEIPYDTVFPPGLDAGNLHSRYDVIILPSGAVQDSLRESNRSRDVLNVPAEWQARMGRFTKTQTLPQLRAFLEEGGRVVAIGWSTSLAKHLGLPIQMPRFKREEFFVPGSVLAINVDTTQALALGMPAQAMALFDQDPFFVVDAPSPHIRVVATYPNKPLRSGWAWGQEKMGGAAAVLDVDVGKGRLFMFGPEITFRSQSHGTYKFLFNAIYSQ